MIVNSKFRPPIEVIEVNPIKKNHDYYKTTGNLWESKYLTSAKIAKYYHDIQQTFLTGPNSPYNLSLKDSTDTSKAQKKKIITRKNLKQLNLTSDPLQNSLNQSNIKPETLSKLKITIHDKPLTPSNPWERLNSLPACKLRHVIPQKIIEKDLQGVQNIMDKSQELDKLKSWLDNKKQDKNMRTRLATINRHNFLKDLEKRCGINKIRQKNSMEGTFGYIKIHKTRKRTEELSKPRSAPKNSNFDHEDFRGLLHADYEEAISKVNSIIIKKKQDNPPTNKSHESIDAESLKELDEFENRRNMSRNSNHTSVEIMSFDMAKDLLN
ncbi:hypothetical protein SteCoe_34579 [Stentor coeruleus]|uniref:Uncharacterized protein n=1 Tax=Stentor coeruleus TaxID=5963 RepID=A0A1R2AU76_9CILI|nr:hypothetical protein SteCoe_34579 [Stentor coeruleus]